MISYLLYIDPGTGSLFYQAILSGILTVSVFYKSIKTYITNTFFNSNKAEVNKAEVNKAEVNKAEVNK